MVKPQYSDEDVIGWPRHFLITFEPSRCDYATAHASDVSCAGQPALGGSSRWSARPPAWLTVPGARDIQRHPLVSAERTQSPKSAGLGFPSLALPCTSQCPSPAYPLYTPTSICPQAPPRARGLPPPRTPGRKRRARAAFRGATRGERGRAGPGEGARAVRRSSEVVGSSFPEALGAGGDLLTKNRFGRRLSLAGPGGRRAT